MTYITSNNCYLSNLLKAPAFIAPGDVVQFSVNVRLRYEARDTINPPLVVGICKNDGSDFQPLYSYSEKALASNSSVTINVSAKVASVPTYANGSGAYAICVKGTGKNGTEYAPMVTDVGTALDRRRPPVGSYSFADTRGFYSLRNKYISGESLLVFYSDWSPDSRDPDTRIAAATLTIAGTAYDVKDTPTLEIGEITASGDVPWSVTVTDNMGAEFSAAGTLPYLDYTRPVIEALSVERYSTSYDEHGEPVYSRDDSSDTVWVNARFSVGPLEGTNDWTFRASWNGGSALIRSGSYGGISETITQDRSAITFRFDPSVQWPITFILADQVAGHIVRFTLDKAGAIFNIERYGVSVGMRSTSTPDRQKFEVAYPAIFYDDMFDGAGNKIGAVHYSTDIAKIGSFGDKPLYRKCLQLSSVAQSSSAEGSNVSMGVTPTDILNIYGFVYSDGVGDIPVNSYGTGERMAFCSPQRSDGQLNGMLKLWTGAANHGARIFIEYTID